MLYSLQYRSQGSRVYRIVTGTQKNYSLYYLLSLQKPIDLSLAGHISALYAISSLEPHDLGRW